MSNNLKLIFISILLLMIGGVLIWYGLKTSTLPSLNVDDRGAQKTGEILPTLTISPSKTASSSSQEVLGTDLVLITKVVDGDTVQIGDESVRLIGIDTPETVDPRRPVQCFGVEASNETKSLLTGKKVYLTRDVSDKDKYNRLLRYIYLPLEDGQLLFVNDYLVREGYAKAYTYPPDVKYSQLFVEAQRQAQIEKKGLWGKC